MMFTGTVEIPEVVGLIDLSIRRGTAGWKWVGVDCAVHIDLVLREDFVLRRGCYHVVVLPWHSGDLTHGDAGEYLFQRLR